MLPFKRCSFRASRATGLVGMQENSFLGDFFGCVGLLPLTNESASQIREAIVKIMAPAAPQHEEASLVEGGQSGTLLGWGTLGNAFGVQQLPQDPSFSTFWSAVALGAIAKGCPFNAEVERYLQLAGQALAACRFGTTSAELAKASAILTYVYSLMGDMAKFREYLELSEYFLQASFEQGSTNKHEGLPDLLLHFRNVGNVESGPMDSCWSPPEGPPQLDRFATKGGLYRFIAESFRAFNQAVYAEAQKRCGRGFERLYCWGPSYRRFDPNDTLPGEVSEAIAAVVATTNSLDFEPLQEAADSPSIRASIGDLLISGTLVFGTAAKGEYRATLEKLDRMVQVYERYPGLCRCLIGSHTSHMLLAILATIDDCRARRMYERLRGAFNSCRASDTPPMPPWHEWHGMAAICSDFHCRVVETLIQSQHMKAFTTPSVQPVHDRACLARTTGNQIARHIHTSVSHWEDAIAAPASQGSSYTRAKTTSGWAKNQDPVGAVYNASATLAPLNTQSSSSYQPDTGFRNISSANGVAAKAIRPSPRSAGIGKHHADTAWLDDDEIAAGDLLKIVNAVLNAVHA
ncbi:unnamed protein product [Scytosiphon promiscuus]